MADSTAAVHHSLRSPEEDVETQSFGMWVFLAGEVMFFGALITAYIIYRGVYPEAFAEASSHLFLWLGTLNTAILLTSSFTMALAVHFAREGKKKILIGMLLATALLGAGFLAVKGVEYYMEFQENLFPGGNFEFPGPLANQAKLFFSFYFSATGLHAVHLTIGILAVLGVAGWSLVKQVGPENYAPVELIGLFWHFVDIVWIFLFPMLYLIDHM